MSWYSLTSLVHLHSFQHSYFYEAQFSLSTFLRVLCGEKPSPQLSEQKTPFKLLVKCFVYGQIKPQASCQVFCLQQAKSIANYLGS